MSEYCDCCTSNTEYIRQHYDPHGLTRPTDIPESVLAMFQECADEVCPLDIYDVRAYIDELREERAR